MDFPKRTATCHVKGQVRLVTAVTRHHHSPSVAVTGRPAKTQLSEVAHTSQPSPSRV